jgi:hypothetical protein
MMAINAVGTIHTVCWRRSLELLAVKFASTTSQTLGSLLRSDVALRFGKHLIADLKLANSSAAKQWWIEMDMEMTALDFFRRTSQRGLMYTHA